MEFRKHMKMVVFALGTLVSSVLAQPRETYASDDPSGLHEKLQSIVDFHSAFWNCSFSFAVHNDTMEIAVAAGANDWAKPTTSRLTPNSQIPMGSTTKMYTAVSVVRLAEAGTIHLDQPVAPLIDKYLAKPMPCEQSPAYCEVECAPISYCFVQPKPACTNTTDDIYYKCSYCLRYLHCYPTARGRLW